MNRVLLVDDEINVLEGLQRKLHPERLYFECESARSGAEALERVKQGGIDAIVSDIKMPGMDGIDLLTRLKADPATQHIPVIMLTGMTEGDARRLTLQLGAYDFVAKPADPHELSARLRNALRLKSYEDRLRTQNRTLEEQVFQLQKLEVIGILAGGVAHDLSNILGSIGGHTELAAIDIKENSPAWNHLQSVMESVDHAAKLARQILTIGQRTDTGRTSCNPGAIIDECLRMLSASITPDLTVDWDNHGLDAPLWADPTQIRQVIMNLCINAVQAMDGKGRLRITMKVQDLDMVAASDIGEIPAGRYLKLSIADTGHGMDAATKSRLFEPFFTTKGPSRGTGLGLTVTEKIVHNHGGGITVDSEPNRGTTFHIYLPVKSATQPVLNDSDGVIYARAEAHSVR
ncbi:MAG: response regulator [candidate division Zixibacteria bacterium]|nr:response regulator [candidate division Zixibacteria bacterium]